MPRKPPAHHMAWSPSSKPALTWNQWQDELADLLEHQSRARTPPTLNELRAWWEKGMQPTTAARRIAEGRIKKERGVIGEPEPSLRKVENFYTDPSAAHERALKWQRIGLRHVNIEPHTTPRGVRGYSLIGYGTDEQIRRL